MKDVDIGKLFAKHIKLADHVEYLTKTKLGIAVGTPGRIGKLFTDTGTSLRLSLAPPPRHAPRSPASHDALG